MVRRRWSPIAIEVVHWKVTKQDGRPIRPGWISTKVRYLIHGAEKDTGPFHPQTGPKPAEAIASTMFGRFNHEFWSSTPRCQGCTAGRECSAGPRPAPDARCLASRKGGKKKTDVMDFRQLPG